MYSVSVLLLLLLGCQAAVQEEEDLPTDAVLQAVKLLQEASGPRKLIASDKEEESDNQDGSNGIIKADLEDDGGENDIIGERGGQASIESSRSPSHTGEAVASSNTAPRRVLVAAAETSKNLRQGSSSRSGLTSSGQELISTTIKKGRRGRARVVTVRRPVSDARAQKNGGKVEARENSDRNQGSKDSSKVQEREKSARVAGRENSGRVQGRENKDRVQSRGNSKKVQERENIDTAQSRENNDKVQDRENKVKGRVQGREANSSVQRKNNRGRVQGRENSARAQVRQNSGRDQDRENNNKVQGRENTGRAQGRENNNKVQGRENSDNSQDRINVNKVQPRETDDEQLEVNEDYDLSSLTPKNVFSFGDWGKRLVPHNPEAKSDTPPQAEAKKSTRRNKPTRAPTDKPTTLSVATLTTLPGFVTAKPSSAPRKPTAGTPSPSRRADGQRFTPSRQRGTTKPHVTTSGRLRGTTSPRRRITTSAQPPVTTSPRQRVTTTALPHHTTTAVPHLTSPITQHVRFPGRPGVTSGRIPVTTPTPSVALGSGTSISGDPLFNIVEDIPRISSQSLLQGDEIDNNDNSLLSSGILRPMQPRPFGPLVSPRPTRPQLLTPVTTNFLQPRPVTFPFTSVTPATLLPTASSLKSPSPAVAPGSIQRSRPSLPNSQSVNQSSGSNFSFSFNRVPLVQDQRSPVTVFPGNPAPLGSVSPTISSPGPHITTPFTSLKLTSPSPALFTSPRPSLLTSPRPSLFTSTVPSSLSHTVTPGPSSFTSPSPFTTSPPPFTQSPSSFSSRPPPFIPSPSAISSSPSPFASSQPPFTASPSSFTSRPSTFIPSAISSSPSPFTPSTLSRFASTSSQFNPSITSSSPRPFTSSSPSPFTLTNPPTFTTSSQPSFTTVRPPSRFSPRPASFRSPRPSQFSPPRPPILNSPQTSVISSPRQQPVTTFRPTVVTTSVPPTRGSLPFLPTVTPDGQPFASTSTPRPPHSGFSFNSFSPGSSSTNSLRLGSPNRSVQSLLGNRQSTQRQESTKKKEQSPLLQSQPLRGPPKSEVSFQLKPPPVSSASSLHLPTTSPGSRHLRPLNTKSLLSPSAAESKHQVPPTTSSFTPTPIPSRIPFTPSLTTFGFNRLPSSTPHSLALPSSTTASPPRRLVTSPRPFTVSHNTNQLFNVRTQEPRGRTTQPTPTTFHPPLPILSGGTPKKSQNEINTNSVNNRVPSKTQQTPTRAPFFQFFSLGTPSSRPRSLQASSPPPPQSNVLHTVTSRPPIVNSFHSFRVPAPRTSAPNILNNGIQGFQAASLPTTLTPRLVPTPFNLQKTVTRGTQVPIHPTRTTFTSPVRNSPFPTSQPVVTTSLSPFFAAFGRPFSGGTHTVHGGHVQQTNAGNRGNVLLNIVNNTPSHLPHSDNVQPNIINSGNAQTSPLNSGNIQSNVLTSGNVKTRVINQGNIQTTTQKTGENQTSDNTFHTTGNNNRRISQTSTINSGNVQVNNINSPFGSVQSNINNGVNIPPTGSVNRGSRVQSNSANRGSRVQSNSVNRGSRVQSNSANRGSRVQSNSANSGSVPSNNVHSNTVHPKPAHTGVTVNRGHVRFNSVQRGSKSFISNNQNTAQFQRNNVNRGNIQTNNGNERNNQNILRQGQAQSNDLNTGSVLNNFNGGNTQRNDLNSEIIRNNNFDSGRVNSNNFNQGNGQSNNLQTGIAQRNNLNRANGQNNSGTKVNVHNNNLNTGDVQRHSQNSGSVQSNEQNRENVQSDSNFGKNKDIFIVGGISQNNNVNQQIAKDSTRNRGNIRFRAETLDRFKSTSVEGGQAQVQGQGEPSRELPSPPVIHFGGFKPMLHTTTTPSNPSFFLTPPASPVFGQRPGAPTSSPASQTHSPARPTTPKNQQLFQASTLRPTTTTTPLTATTFRGKTPSKLFSASSPNTSSSSFSKTLNNFRAVTKPPVTATTFSPNKLLRPLTQTPATVRLPPVTTRNFTPTSTARPPSPQHQVTTRSPFIRTSSKPRPALSSTIQPQFSTTRHSTRQPLRSNNSAPQQVSQRRKSSEPAPPSSTGQNQPTSISRPALTGIRESISRSFRPLEPITGKSFIFVRNGNNEYRVVWH